MVQYLHFRFLKIDRPLITIAFLTMNQFFGWQLGVQVESPKWVIFQPHFMKVNPALISSVGYRTGIVIKLQQWAAIQICESWADHFYHFIPMPTCVYIYIYLGMKMKTTSLFSLTGIMVNKGNRPQMAQLFRLVKYYNLPIYLSIYIYTLGALGFRRVSWFSLIHMSKIIVSPQRNVDFAHSSFSFFNDNVTELNF